MIVVLICAAPADFIGIFRRADLCDGAGSSHSYLFLVRIGQAGHRHFVIRQRGAVIKLGSAAGFDRQGGFFHRQGSLHQCQVGIGARHVDPVFIEDVHFQPVFADARVRPAAGNGARPGIVPEEPAVSHRDSAAGERRAVVRLA